MNEMDVYIYIEIEFRPNFSVKQKYGRGVIIAPTQIGEIDDIFI
jgi:hypothetical protein